MGVQVGRYVLTNKIKVNTNIYQNNKLLTKKATGVNARKRHLRSRPGTNYRISTTDPLFRWPRLDRTEKKRKK